jgi:hypothetical protein
MGRARARAETMAKARVATELGREARAGLTIEAKAAREMTGARAAREMTGARAARL